ncbi:ATPase family associated with various cellular activities (AAA) family protein [Cryptosporidium meleagridis]|uniref:ATPase family associated with various cellular activities (AAA) family protein n=1 Tax=Cryptosporidium meleagridis TaxID=93969 RepID=A0A2P4Z2I4_9CRYT|nr:ATPase family associated with various cellular activities (AAA) family protein [Cryptosporidium meleagridis]
MEEAQLPWVEKYRPSGLQELLSHRDIINTIEKFISSGQLPHLLFHGPPGTGKTSTIHAISKCIYKDRKYQMVLELNASDDRGINVVRDAIKSFSESASTTLNNSSVKNSNAEDIEMFDASTRNLDCNKSLCENIKLIILDEADMMTSTAQMALRRIMERYSEHVRFCIICNYVNKITPALQSRCTRFRFSPLPIEDIRNRISEIALSERIFITREGQELIIKSSRGDMRKVLNVLQSCSMSNYGNIQKHKDSGELNGASIEGLITYINEEMIYRILGIPKRSELDNIFGILSRESFSSGFNALQNSQNENGYSTQDFVNGLYSKSMEANWPDEVVPLLMKRLADIEYRLSRGASESIQLAAIVSCFHEVRMEMEKLV